MGITIEGNLPKDELDNNAAYDDILVYNNPTPNPNPTQQHPNPFVFETRIRSDRGDLNTDLFQAAETNSLSSDITNTTIENARFPSLLQPGDHIYRSGSAIVIRRPRFTASCSGSGSVNSNLELSPTLTIALALASNTDEVNATSQTSPHWCTVTRAGLSFASSSLRRTPFDFTQPSGITEARNAIRRLRAYRTDPDQRIREWGSRVTSIELANLEINLERLRTRGMTPSQVVLDEFMQTSIGQFVIHNPLVAFLTGTASAAVVFHETPIHWEAAKKLVASQGVQKALNQVLGTILRNPRALGIAGGIFVAASEVSENYTAVSRGERTRTQAIADGVVDTAIGAGSIYAGALVGAKVGAAMGTVLPGAGNIIGAAAGLVVGGLISWGAHELVHHTILDT